MAIYLHEKYASKIDKKFSLESISKGRFTGKVDFTGVKTVRITTPQTVPLGDYKRSGTNRYGDPKEMQDTVQEMTLTQDKSFAMTIDKGNNTDQGALKAAGKMLALEIQQECVPALDQVCLWAGGKSGGHHRRQRYGTQQVQYLRTADQGRGRSG